MRENTPRLVVQAAPFLREGVTTPGLMRDVLLALAPVLGMAVWHFGLSALLVVLAATLGSVATEWLLGPKGPHHSSVVDGTELTSLTDGSAALTGVLLGLTLPPTLPLWMAVLGGAVGIGLGKLVWGGLGQNLFNPALVGRAFLQAAFPTALTTWVVPGGVTGSSALLARNFAWPFLSAPPVAEGLSGATPLNVMKFAHQPTPFRELLWGNIAGSLGETSLAVLALAGLWLLVRRAFDWRIPTSILLTVAAFSGFLFVLVPERYPSPGFMLGAGGLLFGAVFMATDPVTSPLAPRGAWLYGIGIGLLVVLIRIWGGLPEGVMYAILLMNAATPLLERFTQPRAFGHARGLP
jgi:Na+-translocating ferredoxin:NAD+ oxidoreductase subunit D